MVPAMANSSGSKNTHDISIHPAPFPGNRASPLFLIFLYCCCALVTVAYVNFYLIYRFLNEHLGAAFITWTPIVSVLVLLPLFVTTIIHKRKPGGEQLQWNWVIFGAALTLAALIIPDANFAVKRIHVTEYFLLSLLVRFTLSHRHAGADLLLLSCLFTILCGIHDELLQGLHPQRTYGLRDITVNSLAAVAGGCVWHGLGLFSHTRKTEVANGDKILPTLYLSWLSLAVILAIIPIFAFKHSNMPMWIFLPLSASIVLLSCFFTRLISEQRHGVMVVSCAAFLLLLYPVVIHVFPITFY